MHIKNKKKSLKTTIVVSGGFDPIHIGHIRMIKEAKAMGDRLVVILNNDNWLKKKKTTIFMHQKERKEILESIEGVDKVVITSHKSNPKDMSVSREILKIKPDIFANGGDRRVEDDVPEAEACRTVGCKLVFGVGQGGKIQSSSWLLARYIKKIKSKKLVKVEHELKKISKAFSISNVGLLLECKIRLARVILNLVNRKDDFGLFVILGWKEKWIPHTDVPDSKQDIYVRHHVNVMDIGKKDSDYEIESTINFDGAILINEKGEIIHSGLMIEGLKPKEIAQKINPGKFKDLSEQFGFKRKVHLRHLSAISASYIFKGTTVFTVSEENNSFHIYEGGKIIYRLIGRD